MPSKMSDQWYRDQAYEKHHEEGQIEIDNMSPKVCKVSRNEDGDNGAYVQAWVWVPDPEETDE